MKPQGKTTNKNVDNIEATGNNLDDIDHDFLDDDSDNYTNVTADVNYNEVTGIDYPDGTNALEGMDDSDSINQLANMDNVASRKGMIDLQDTDDMQNTDGINNIDDLDSSDDIGYSEDEEEDEPYVVRCPHCSYQFEVAYITVRDDIQVTCPKCGVVFESEAHVIS